MTSFQDAIVVLISVPSLKDARSLAEMLVAEQLAACVQILPQIESVYRWIGEIKREPEILLIAKTLQEKFESLEERVRSTHSYEVPEIIAFPTAAISKKYLEWLVTTLNREGESAGPEPGAGS